MQNTKSEKKEKEMHCGLVIHSDFSVGEQ